MAQNEEAAPTPASAAPKAGGGNKLIFIILGMNVLMMGVVLFVVLRKPSGSAPAHTESPAPTEKSEAPAGEHGAPGGAPKPGPILKLENFVIQLRGVDQDRYVRVSFDIEVAADIDREAVQVRLPQIRDSIISFFSDRTLDELRGSEGIERTKMSIMKRMEEIVPGRRVRALYITDFIIQ
jgi:flagellar protein FliL